MQPLLVLRPRREPCSGAVIFVLIPPRKADVAEVDGFGQASNHKHTTCLIRLTSYPSEEGAGMISRLPALPQVL